MRLTLKRFADFGDGGTLGRLRLSPSWECWSLEAPWRGNERNVSCIPAAFYRLEQHHGQRYTDTFALVGEGVSHWETPRVARFTCVFHPARFARHLKGCIAFGLAYYLEDGVPMLRSRGAAHRHVLETLGVGDDRGHELLIEDHPGGWET